VHRTRLYLDFDGCVNAPLAAQAWASRAARMTRLWDLGAVRLELTLAWSPALVAALDIVIAEYDLELVWLTSWCENRAIEQVVPFLGGLAGGVVEPWSGAGTEPVGQWKRRVVGRSAADGVPFIWVDDLEIVRVSPAWLEGVAGVRHLLLTPNGETGLSPADLVRMAAHCASDG